MTFKTILSIRTILEVTLHKHNYRGLAIFSKNNYNNWTQSFVKSTYNDNIHLNIFDQSVPSRNYATFVTTPDVKGNTDTGYDLFRGNDYWLDICNKFEADNIDHYMSSEDWKILFDANPKNNKSWMLPLISFLSTFNQLKRAKSLYDHLKLTDPTISCIVGASLMHYGNNEEITLDIYRDLEPIKNVLPQNVIGKMIHGLAATSKWQEGIELIKLMMISIHMWPSSADYCNVLAAAVSHKDISSFTWVLDSMVKAKKSPSHSNTYKNVFESGNENFINTFIDHMEKGRWIMPADGVDYVTSWFEGNKCRVRRTKISKSAKCDSCLQQLKPVVGVEKKDFDRLQNAMLDRVIISDNIFLKSSPSELSSFKHFLENSQSFDVVVDGLNVAYISKSRSTDVMSRYLKECVEKFVKQRKRVLVLGRQYMRRWPIKNMRYILDCAKMYYLDNESADDPYLLYSALYAGNNCYFVSSDEMRNHKFAVGEELGNIFLKWQRSRQITCFKFGHNITLKMPDKHETVAQHSETHWHMPYESDKDEMLAKRELHFGFKQIKSFQTSNSWICVEK